MTFYFKKSSVALLLLVGFSLLSFAQKESWETYIKKANNDLIEVTVNIDLFFTRPNYKNLLVVATETKHCFKNGLPKTKGLEEFYTFSDSLAYKIEKLTKNKLAGILTYNCTGFDIYYVKDTTNLRNELNQSMKKNFSNRKNYLNIRPDKKWAYFIDYLMPNDLSNDFFINHEYLTEFVRKGDALEAPRKINHWFYFNNIKRRTKFVNRTKGMKFSIDSLNYKKEKRYPYQVVISRKDSVNPSNVSSITKKLKLLSQRYYGKYDGWEMEAILKD